MNLESILPLSVSMRIKMQEELIIWQTIFAFYLCIMKQFTRAYCQFPVCGPSRASMMFGYYPNATESYGYTSGREKVGEERISWSQLFKNNGNYTARVSKIFHMGISGDIPDGANGADDEASWTERFNSQGPEWMVEGEAELVQNNTITWHTTLDFRISY